MKYAHEPIWSLYINTNMSDIKSDLLEKFSNELKTKYQSLQITNLRVVEDITSTMHFKSIEMIVDRIPDDYDTIHSLEETCKNVLIDNNIKSNNLRSITAIQQIGKKIYSFEL